MLHIRTGRQPHEVLILAFSVVVGCIGVVIPEQVGYAIAAVLHGVPIHIYYGGLAAFSALTLCGIFYPKIEGLMVERVGLAVVGLHYAIYVVCIVAYAGFGAVMGALLPTAYMVANLARIRQIHVDLALLKSYLADHPGIPFVR